MDTLEYKYDLWGHTDEVTCLSISRSDPKSLFVVSGSKDNQVRLWDCSTGECVQVYEDHESEIICVQFVQHKIISASKDGEIKLWDTRSDRCYNTLYGHTFTVTSLTVNEKGTYAVSGGEDTLIVIWDISDLRQAHSINTLGSHKGTITQLEFNEKIIVSTSEDMTVKIWSFTTGLCLNSIHLNSLVTSLQLCGTKFEEIKIIVTHSNILTIWNFSPDNSVRVERNLQKWKKITQTLFEKYKIQDKYN